MFDLSGRRVAVVRGAAGSPLVWEARNDAGDTVPNGIYLYRMVVEGRPPREGKVVVVR